MGRREIRRRSGRGEPMQDRGSREREGEAEGELCSLGGRIDRGWVVGGRWDDGRDGKMGRLRPDQSTNLIGT